jgi:hypothetical protein
LYVKLARCFNSKRFTVIANGLFAQAQHGGDFLDAHVLGQSEQRVDTFNQPERTAGMGLLQTAIELLAREGTEG